MLYCLHCFFSKQTRFWLWNH